MSRPTPVRFYFDFVSPYSYLCWPQLLNLVDRYGCSLDLCPVLFAALLDHYGNLGPAEIPSKRSYIFRHACRVARDQGIDFRSPCAHPFNPLLALRVVSVEMSASRRIQLISRLFAAIWTLERDIQDPTIVAECLRSCGLDSETTMNEAQSDAGKLRVRNTTQGAIDCGVFGVPTMIVNGEIFWGIESIPHIDRFLAGNDNLDQDQVDRWQAIPAAARRPRSLS